MLIAPFPPIGFPATPEPHLETNVCSLESRSNVMEIMPLREIVAIITKIFPHLHADQMWKTVSFLLRQL
jgi:hypothetical protein